MIITKEITVNIDIHNYENVFTDTENNVKRILETRYLGKCFSSCFIKEITRIVRIGDCIINQDGSPSFGTMSVIFEVRAIVYIPHEIINGCVVKNRDKNAQFIVCDAENASIYMALPAIFNSVTVGQIISVIVYQAKYTVASKKIAINAVPFLPNHNIIIYKYVPDDNDYLLNDVLQRIESEEKMRETIREDPSKKRAWDTFEQLIYAYQTPQSVPTGAQMMDIRKFIKSKKSGYVSRDARLNLVEPNLYVFNEIPAGDTVRAGQPGCKIMLGFLENYCNYLRTVREMVAIYSDENIVTNHRNLWQIFKKSKK